ncbi:MAG: radical SAM protein [Tissierellia bacterium]|nr:radical SAM protein [Tissierellia bacterium]
MICEPLELEYLVSNVPKEISNMVDLKIIDMIIEKESYESIIERESPEFIVFTGYITHVNLIKDLSKVAKMLLKNVKTGVGGVHAEVVPEDFNSPYIDFIYNSNGIDSFNETLIGLVGKKSIDEIKNNIIKIGPKKTNFNYNHPNRKSTDKYRKSYYYMFHNPCALIKTSFGCPYNCSFCFCKEITDGKYFTRDMEDVMDELEGISEEEIYIVDDDFLHSPKRLDLFINSLKARNINKKYLVYGRADFIVENEDLLSRLKDSGLQAVIVGIESVRSQDLKDYQKGTTKEINEKAIKILQNLDIELYATLIIPLDFTKRDFNQLTEWLKTLNVRFVNLQPLTPLPGTDIFHQYIDKLLVKREDHEVWDMAHVILKPEHMTIRKFYMEILKSYYKVVMRPKHVIALIKKYGWKENWKMLMGSSFVSWQYLKKIVNN